MIYSTSRCPYCNMVVNRKTNPVPEIGNPFEVCPYCRNTYLNKNKSEWITKSPIDRVLFFLNSGVWARAFICPMLVILPLTDKLNATELMVPLWAIAFMFWIVVGFLVHKKCAQKDIEASLKRTEDLEYLELLKKAGFDLYPERRGRKKQSNSDEVVAFDEKEIREDEIETIRPKGNDSPELLDLSNNEKQYIKENDIIDNGNEDAKATAITERNKSTELDEEIAFCRKCGTQLLSDSEFCHKCGCEKVRQKTV